MVVVSILVGIGVLILLFKPIFGRSSAFFKYPKSLRNSDIIPMPSAQYRETWKIDRKMSLWLALGILAGVGTYIVLLKIFS